MKFSIFVATASPRRRSHKCRRDERVRERNNRIPISTQFWPDVSRCDLLFVSECPCSSTFALDTQLSSLLLWFLAYRHQRIMFSFFAATPQKTAEDDKHFTIISGLRAIKNKSFLRRNSLISVIGASWNSEEFFFFEERAFYRLNQEIMLIKRYNLFSSFRNTTKDDKRLNIINSSIYQRVKGWRLVPFLNLFFGSNVHAQFHACFLGLVQLKH